MCQPTLALNADLVAVLFGSLHDGIQNCFALLASRTQRLQFVGFVDEQNTASRLDLCLYKSKMFFMNFRMFAPFQIFDEPVMRFPGILKLCRKPLLIP